jgi:asparagine synthase (glutamine-hydrolysing)
MCGIAGIFNYRDRDRAADMALLARMANVIRHRGPDGEGFFNDGPLGFAHRRLSIVDLSPTGHQPMATADRSAWIIYNGEFYNHAEFRPHLEAAGVRFRGTSDTETLLYLMANGGAEQLAKTAGIFAFAYWDPRAHTLTLARDPLGVKQLYFHDDGSRVIFASEIKALFCDPTVPRELDSEGLNQYLHFHTPLFDRTFFRGIRQLRQGEIARVDRSGMRFHRYWQIDDATERHEPPAEQAAALQELLAQVVGDQLMSDVPVGSFFSGGIDSTAVAKFAIRAGKRPRCFGVHFTGQGVIDERPFQEAAARTLGLDLDLVTVPASGFPDDLARAAYYQDQPVIGPALIPMDYVSRLAASHVKVCLGGQAADELFGGYARYALTKPGAVLGSYFHRAPSDGGAVGGNLKKQLLSWRNVRRLGRAAMHLTSWRRRYFEHFAKVPQSVWQSVLGDPSMVRRSACRSVFDETVARSPASDPAQQAMHWDMQTYLPGLFQQDDRMSMSHSLESRVPIADPRMVRFAFQTPFALKFRRGATKWILRQALAGVVPDMVLNRRKVGFDTPVESWMRDAHRGYVRDMLLGAPARQRGLWNTSALERLLDRTGDPYWTDVIWKSLSIEVWARTFLDRAPVPQVSDLPAEVATV